MVTLYDVTQKTKTLLKWGGIIIGGLIAIILFFRIGGAVKELFFPTPPPPPTVKFGKLPAIDFPESVTQKTLTFSINTVSGKLPEIASRISVYKITLASANLLAQKKAQDATANLGFSQPGVRITESLYQWTDRSTFNKQLLLDIFSYNFTITSNYLSNPVMLDPQYALPKPPEAILTAQEFLSGLGALSTDLDEEKTKTTSFAISNGTLVPASLAFSQVIRIDFFQKDIDQQDEVAKKQLATIPIYYPHPPYSPMTFYVSPSVELRGSIVFASYFHQNISGNYATYPIKTVEQAFRELEDGQAYIASYHGDDSTIPINDVKLAYFMGVKEQEYLMPVYVFSGENGFFAYVAAITNDWLQL